MRAFPISGPEPRPGTPVGNGAAPPKGVRAGPLPWAGSPKQGITPRGQGLNSTGAASLRWAPQRLRTPHTPSSPMWTFSEDNQRDQAPRTPDSGDGREQGLPPLSESPRVSEWRGHPELLPRDGPSLLRAVRPPQAPAWAGTPPPLRVGHNSVPFCWPVSPVCPDGWDRVIYLPRDSWCGF